MAEQSRARVARYIDRMGTRARGSGRYRLAMRLHTAALALARRGVHQGDETVASMLNQYGMACKYFGVFDEGEAAYREALTILADDPAAAFERATILHNLAGIQYASGQIAEAEATALNGIAARSAVVAPEHRALLADRAAYASILHRLGRPDEAEQELRDVIDEWKKIVPEDHYEVAVNTNNLAAVLADNGRLDEAAELYRRALEVKEHLLGSDHPDVAVSLNNLAVLRRRGGDAAEAATLCARALAILGKRLDPGHPQLAACRRNLEMAQGELARLY